MRRIFGVYGAGGFGREVMCFLRAQYCFENSKEAKFVFIDDGRKEEELNGYEILSFEGFLALDADERFVTIAISDGLIREKLLEKCNARGIQQVNIRSNNTVILEPSEIDQASILCPFVTVSANAKIGKAFHANNYSYIAHDCVIGDFVTFAPGVICNGNVLIQDFAYIGANAVIKQGRPGSPLVIGRGAIVGMGAVVTKNVADGTTVVGNPARLFK